MRMSDLAETANNTAWKVRLGVSSGEVISVASREVTVARVSSQSERKISERPVMMSQLQLEDVSQSDSRRFSNKICTAGDQGLPGGPPGGDHWGGAAPRDLPRRGKSQQHQGTHLTHTG